MIKTEKNLFIYYLKRGHCGSTGACQCFDLASENKKGCRLIEYDKIQDNIKLNNLSLAEKFERLSEAVA